MHTATRSQRLLVRCGKLKVTKTFYLRKLTSVGDHVGNAIIAGITGSRSRRANRYGVELLSEAHTLPPMEVRDEKSST